MHINYWRETKKSVSGKIGIGIILLVVLLALVGPLVAPYQPFAYSGSVFTPPSRLHWLGTNDVGQDILTQLIYGARSALIIGCGVSLLSTLLSFLIGGTAALLGGLYERFWMRAVDVWLVIPPLIVVILVAAYTRAGTCLLIVLLAAFFWPNGSRVVRAQTLSLKERLSVYAARSFGAGWKYLLLRHILPELKPILMVILVQNMRRAVFMEAGLSFLGVSDPLVISWGRMMHQALWFVYLDAWQWWLAPVAIALSLTILGFTLVGYNLETALNPELKQEVAYAGD